MGLILVAFSVWFCFAGQWIPLAVLWGVPITIRLIGALLLTETKAARLFLAGTFEDVEMTEEEADSVTTGEVQAMVAGVMVVDALAIGATLASVVYFWA